MIYECDICEAVLGPGWIVCPHCGQTFDEPVPADALGDDFVPTAAPETIAEPPALEDAAPLDAVVLPRFRANRRRWSPSTVAALLLFGGIWLGYHQWDKATAPEPVRLPAPPPPTDLAAHQQYAVHMAAFVQELRAMGIEAEWPAFGSNDMLVVTPKARIAEPPIVWDADGYRRLAQGIYGHFAQTRFESGFTDTDTTACFVLVTSASGEVVAVDFMGDLK